MVTLWVRLVFGLILLEVKDEIVRRKKTVYSLSLSNFHVQPTVLMEHGCRRMGWSINNTAHMSSIWLIHLSELVGAEAQYLSKWVYSLLASAMEVRTHVTTDLRLKFWASQLLIIQSTLPSNQFPVLYHFSDFTSNPVILLGCFGGSKSSQSQQFWIFLWTIW